MIRTSSFKLCFIFILIALFQVPLGAALEIGQYSSDLSPFNFEQLKKDLLKNTSNNSKGDTKSVLTWTPRENPITQLKLSEFKKMLGEQSIQKLSPLTDVEVESVAESESTRALPEVLDWRNKEGINYIPPIQNQGSCGSCVAFATIGLTETQLNIDTGLAFLGTQLSPQSIFSCGGGRCNGGWSISKAASYMTYYGAPDESCFPYSSGSTGLDRSCRSSCADRKDRSIKANTYRVVTKGVRSLVKIKEALQKGPLLTSMSIYEDFMAYGGGVYRHRTGYNVGGHAVVIVGYDDHKNAFIIRNSWGKDWGEGGYVYISYDDVSGIGRETYQLDMAQDQSIIQVTAPQERAFLKGKQKIKIESPAPDIKSLSFEIKNPDTGETLLKQECKNIKKCEQSVDMSSFQDGQYILETQTTTQQSKIFEGHRRFTIQNHSNQPEIVFQKLSDSSSVWSGIERVRIQNTNDAIPGEVYLLVKKPDSEEILLRRYLGVGYPVMLLKWKSYQVPNGHYDVQFEGVTQVQSLSGIETLRSLSKKLSIEIKN